MRNCGCRAWGIAVKYTNLKIKTVSIEIRRRSNVKIWSKYIFDHLLKVWPSVKLVRTLSQVSCVLNYTVLQKRCLSYTFIWHWSKEHACFPMVLDTLIKSLPVRKIRKLLVSVIQPFEMSLVVLDKHSIPWERVVGLSAVVLQWLSNLLDTNNKSFFSQNHSLITTNKQSPIYIRQSVTELLV